MKNHGLDGGVELDYMYSNIMKFHDRAGPFGVEEL